MIRPFLIAAALVVCAAPIAAQTPSSAPPVEFVPRAVFYVGAELLAGPDDPRYRWDADFGGEIDIVDYRVGRFTFATNYEVILGEELRAFDPNQGNYILEGGLSARLPAVELAAVLYHQSRHLADRPKQDPVDWNMFGVRAQRAFIAGATHVQARADLRGTFMHSYVDYRWELDGRVRGDQVLRPGIGLLFAGAIRYLGVDGTRARGGQTGFRTETGLRFDGVAGGAELYVAAERRIDPYPLDFGTATWVTAGFRLLTR